MDLLLENIGALATPTGAAARRGAAQREILLVRDAMVGIEDGIIEYAGPACPGLSADRTFDCGGRLVTPGLVDAHTHLVFGGWRQNELSPKLGGASYLDILKSGGGILSTVEHTRAASEGELYKKSKAHLSEMLRLGVTTCEAKSGYGLNMADELKQLRVARELDEAQPVDIASTFMGAHAVPKEYSGNRAGYIDFLIGEMLPVIAREKLAEFCDVFCETAVFTPDESRRILLEAKRNGLAP